MLLKVQIEQYKACVPTSSCQWVIIFTPSHWRHNDHGGVSNHQPHGCLLNRLFRRRSKKTSKLHVTGLCAGKSPGPVNSPQSASNAENGSIWWRHHDERKYKIHAFADIPIVTSYKAKCEKNVNCPQKYIFSNVALIPDWGKCVNWQSLHISAWTIFDILIKKSCLHIL